MDKVTFKAGKFYTLTEILSALSDDYFLDIEKTVLKPPWNKKNIDNVAGVSYVAIAGVPVLQDLGHMLPGSLSAMGSSNGVFLWYYFSHHFLLKIPDSNESIMYVVINVS